MLGVVAICAGMFAVLTGTGGQLDGESTNPSVESEFRFFAAFWVAFGVAALRVAPRVDREITASRALAGFLLLGGVARAVGWIAEGQPHALYIVLMCLELVIAVLVLLLLGRVRRPAD